MLLLSGFARGQMLCPQPADLLPCTCTGNGAGTGVLECENQNLNDDLASRILDSFNTSPTLLYRVNMASNQLTYVPSQITFLTQLNLTWVELKNNKITIIRSGAFNFTNELNELILSSNLISTIEPGSFLGFANFLFLTFVLFYVKKLYITKIRKIWEFFYSIGD